MAKEKGPYEHAEFNGLVNVVPDERLGLGDLQTAVNVDIDDSKRATRRKGFSAPVVAGACHSLWAEGPVALVARGTSLLQMHADYSVSTLRSDLTAGLRLSYAAVGDRVYYSNGAETGAVWNGGDRSWGLAVPEGQPAAEAIGGVLPAGIYQFAVTFLRGDGQESGTPPAGTIDLAETGGIRLSAIPEPEDPGVVRKVIYFSKRDGETLYRAGLLPLGAASFDYPIEASMQVPLTTQHLRPPPAGQFVDYFNGRTLVASGHVLRYSEPYAPELFDLRKGFPFLGDITMLAALDGGVYVGTRDAVVWLDGDAPETWSMRPRMNYGVIQRAFARCSRDMVLDSGGAKPVVVFASTRGICLGEDGGQVSNLTQDRFSYPIQERGAAVVRRHRGFIQAVVSLQGTELAANTTA